MSARDDTEEAPSEAGFTDHDLAPIIVLLAFALLLIILAWR